MRNIKATIQYNGKDFFGFARQPGKRTIEKELIKAFSTVLGEDVSFQVAGRTDTGVHSFGNVINFKTSNEITLYRLRWSINAVLPRDVVVSNLGEADGSFDARSSALSRTYVYYILNRKYPSVFHRDFCYHFSKDLDVKKMAKAAKYLVGKYNFKAFSAQMVKEHTYFRNVKHLTVSQSNDFFDVDKKNLVKIEIQASSFLYNMVRIIVGTLIEVGLGKILPEEVKRILGSKDRNRAGETAPAHGLILLRVGY